MDVVWIFHKILRIIYEKRDFKEKKTKSEWMCLLSYKCWYIEENVFKIFRKTYISENIHKLHTQCILSLCCIKRCRQNLMFGKICLNFLEAFTTRLLRFKFRRLRAILAKKKTQAWKFRAPFCCKDNILRERDARVYI